MSDSPVAARSPSSGCKVSGCFILCVIGFPIFFLLMMAGVINGPVELVFTLFFGWIGFLSRTIPRISWDAGMMASGVALIALILVMGHYFLGWLSKSIAAARCISFVWPWKWTICGVGAVSLCFLVGMAVAGTVHQIGWIMTSNERLFEDRFKYRAYGELHQTAYVLRDFLKKTNTVATFRANLAELVHDPERRLSLPDSGLQSFHLLLLVGADDTVEGVVVFPRYGNLNSKLGSELIERDNQTTLYKADLTAFIKTNQSRLIAL